MGKYLSTFDTLADYEAATSELGYPNVSLIKADGSILYAKNAPISSICYEIIPDTIASYTATTYDSVYSVTDAKWYMLNNLNQYEEYGVYDIVEDIASATTYEGKLGVVDTTEYQYSGGSWNDVGTYEDSTVTYEIDNTDPSPYEGQELSTTFKIPYADVQAVGYVSLFIRDNNSNGLRISLDAGGWTEYRYDGSGFYEGTVTNDGEYFYLSLPSEAPSSIIIQRTEYWDSTPIHLIVDSKQASVEYVEKATPSYSIYSTVEEMEAVSCPNVGINEYAFVGNDLYKYFANEQWDGVEYTNPKMVAFYENETPLIVYNNNNGELTSGEAQANGTSFITAYIGESVTSIGSSAFDGCSYLTSCTISSSVTSIGSNAFQNCRSITSITIPNSVTSIGGSAFYNCSGLTSVTIPDSVTSIGSNVFGNTPWWNTYSADTSHRYGNIIYINDVAYAATSSGITSCTFKEGTLGIGGGAFTNCSGLTSVTIPDSVTSIGGGAFSGCKSLTSVTIPDSVTSIGDFTFSNCSGLTSITIPDSVTSIGDNAFSGCKSLTSIEIPSGVTSIGDWTFSYCSGLTSVTIPDSVTSIGDDAFSGCKSLTSVTIPDSVTSIGSSAFQSCTSLTSVTIPSGVTSIGESAFNSCKSLTSITVNATTPPTLGINAYNSTNNCPIYVPSASVDAYKAATNWSTYASRIQAIP